MLPQPVALWRTPGGIVGDFFHINGLYDNDPAHFGNPGNGVDMVHWLKVADQLRGGLLHVLNINATDQELVNEIEYLNSPVPPKPGADWTKTKWRFDQQAPEGYFAWLRGQHGHPAPAGVRHVEIGNEIWNFYNDTDNRCKHDATCYGVQSAALIKKLKAKDPQLQVGVSILTIGQGANKGYRAPRIYQGLAAAGTYPDFVFDHAYYNCGYTKEDAAQASYQAGYADVLLTAAATNRRELTAALPACGNSIGMFFDEFGPQACAGNADRWEAFGYWETAAVAHVYAAGLHGGYTHVSYYNWNDGSDTGNDGLVYGEPGVVDANFWGLWFASKFVAGAVSEVALEGAPAALRAFAVSSDKQLRVLLINTSASAPLQLSLSVNGRTSTAARAFRMDQSYATIASVPAHRSGVPQKAPVASPVNIAAFTAAPLSTTLLEVDLAEGSAPRAAPAGSGCTAAPSRHGAP